MGDVLTKWGPAAGVDSKDYLLMMEGDLGPTDRPVSLLGHSLTSPNQNLTDALVLNTVEMKNGSIVTVSKTKRAAQETSRTYTVGFPSALMTPLMWKLLQADCQRNLYMKYLCPENQDFAHFHIFPDATLNPPIEAEDPITTDDTTNFITHTSEMQVSKKVTAWSLGWDKVYTEDAATAALFDVAFTSADCAGCTFVPGRSILSSGGIGGVADAAVLRSTEDRFATSVALTTGVAVADSIVSIYTEGELIIIGVADDPVLTTAASGSMLVSRAGGATGTWVAVSGITVPIRAIKKINGVFVAVGGTGAGAPVVYYSTDDATTWTASTSAVITGTDAFVDAAVDDVNSRLYIVGEGGTLILGTVTGGSLTLTDISSNLPGSPGTLNAVHVFAEGHLAVGGAAGYYAESKNGGTDWTEPDVPGSSAITSIAGNQYRAVVAAGTALYLRDLLSSNVYAAVTLSNGQTVTGNYTRVRMDREDNLNVFVAVTDDGEVVIGKAKHPWA